MTSTKAVPLSLRPAPPPELLDADLTASLQELEEEELSLALREIRDAMQASNLPAEDALLNLGSVLDVANRLEQSKLDYLRQLGKSVRRAGHFNHMGLVLARNGWLLEAEAAFRREIGASPHSAAVYRNLAAVLREQGREEEARLAEQRGAKVGSQQR
ncbi:MAG: hypothetical protein HQL82_02335 [Magnetococcales bacterium]|nr:hypothetical protein [Magnetococcales bacterium]